MALFNTSDLKKRVKGGLKYAGQIAIGEPERQFKEGAAYKQPHVRVKEAVSPKVKMLGTAVKKKLQLGKKMLGTAAKASGLRYR